MIVLMSLAGVFAASVVLYALGILSSQSIAFLIGVCLVYQTLYTIYCIIQYKGRPRQRNKRRANTRPPGSKSSW